MNYIRFALFDVVNHSSLHFLAASIAQSAPGGTRRTSSGHGLTVGAAAERIDVG